MIWTSIFALHSSSTTLRASWYNPESHLSVLRMKITVLSDECLTATCSSSGLSSFIQVSWGFGRPCSKKKVLIVSIVIQGNGKFGHQLMRLCDFQWNEIARFGRTIGFGIVFISWKFWRLLGGLFHLRDKIFAVVFQWCLSYALVNAIWTTERDKYIYSPFWILNIHSALHLLPIYK